jgi:hypothetical protein
MAAADPSLVFGGNLIKKFAILQSTMSRCFPPFFFTQKNPTRE